MRGEGEVNERGVTEDREGVRGEREGSGRGVREEVVGSERDCDKRGAVEKLTIINQYVVYHTVLTKTYLPRTRCVFTCDWS